MTEPGSNSRLVSLLYRAGIVCLILMPLAVLAVRLGVNFRIGLLLFAASGLLAGVVIVLLIIASLLPASRDRRGQVLLKSLPAVPPVLLLSAILSTGGQYPPIHDITTDTEDPPLFDAGVDYRGEGSNPIDIKPDVIAKQKAFYTDLDSIVSELPPETAFQRAASIAEEMGWEIYNSDPTNGLIEAEYTSFWFGFKDDIVIRIRRANGGSEVDLRSVSRVGVSDLGANAARIKAFAESF